MPEPIFDPGNLVALDPSDQRLVTTVVVVAVTGLAFTPAGYDTVRATCAANARLMFTNMRLIPCMAEDTVRRFAGATAEAVSGGSTSRYETSDRSARASADKASGPLDALRDGFSRVVRDVPLETGDERDRRIMAQVGVVLGLVYLAFLTVWFWQRGCDGVLVPDHNARLLEPSTAR